MRLSLRMSLLFASFVIELSNFDSLGVRNYGPFLVYLEVRHIDGEEKELAESSVKQQPLV